MGALNIEIAIVPCEIVAIFTPKLINTIGQMNKSSNYEKIILLVCF